MSENPRLQAEDTRCRLATGGPAGGREHGAAGTKTLASFRRGACGCVTQGSPENQNQNQGHRGVYVRVQHVCAEGEIVRD